MNTSVNSILRIVLFAASVLPLSACASLVGLGTGGQVLEEGTEKPIPDAIVVVRWAGSLPAFTEARAVCVHVETATTDREGHYITHAWRAPSTVGPAPLVQMNVGPSAYAYKPGYEYVDTRGETVYLKPFTGGREARFKYLVRTFGSGCGATDGSEKSSIPLLKAQYEEAQALAQSPEEKRILEFLLYGLETTEVGFEEAQKRHLKRVKNK